MLGTALIWASADEQDRFRQALGEQSDQFVPRRGRFSLISSLESGLIHRSDEYDSLISIVAEAAEGARPGCGDLRPWRVRQVHTRDPGLSRRPHPDLFPDIWWVETGHDCTLGRLVELISDLRFHLDGTRRASLEQTSLLPARTTHLVREDGEFLGQRSCDPVAVAVRGQELGGNLFADVRGPRSAEVLARA